MKIHKVPGGMKAAIELWTNQHDFPTGEDPKVLMRDQFSFYKMASSQTLLDERRLRQILLQQRWQEDISLCYENH